MKQLSIIVAIAENRVIGKDNQLLWHLPADLKMFKQATSGHTIILGRKTWESLPVKPLPNRRHIVITSQKDFSFNGIEVVHSIEDAIALCNSNEETFIVGGEQIYKQLLPFAQTLYITEVKACFDGDAFFPEINLNEWELINSEPHFADEKHKSDFTFLTYKRKS